MNPHVCLLVGWMTWSGRSVGLSVIIKSAGSDTSMLLSQNLFILISYYRKILGLQSKLNAAAEVNQERPAPDTSRSKEVQESPDSTTTCRQVAAKSPADGGTCIE